MDEEDNEVWDYIDKSYQKLKELLYKIMCTRGYYNRLWGRVSVFAKATVVASILAYYSVINQRPL